MYFTSREFLVVESSVVMEHGAAETHYGVSVWLKLHIRSEKSIYFSL